MISESLCTSQRGKQSTGHKKISTEIEVSKNEYSRISLYKETQERRVVSSWEIWNVSLHLLDIAWHLLGTGLTESKMCQESVWTAGKDKYKKANGD